jgi:hypothetical protein
MYHMSVDPMSLFGYYPAAVPGSPAGVMAAMDVRAALDAILAHQPWLAELFAVLPLAVFLDFIDTGRKLHIFQLVGAVPVWSWPVPPAASRILLAERTDEDFEGDDDGDERLPPPCHLDAYGESPQWMAIDGKNGDHYVVANPETVRRCIAASPSHRIPNHHVNMRNKDARVHQLEIVRVTKTSSSARSANNGSLPSIDRSLDTWRRHSTIRFVVVSGLGRVLMALFITAAIVLEFFWGAAFLTTVCLTGLVVHLLHGRQHRRLVHDSPSGMDRMIIVSEHASTTSWKAFYGDSATLKSLLSLPLKPEPSHSSPGFRRVLRGVLQLLILTQWATAVGAATRRDWDSLFIFLWIVFSTVTSALILSPAAGARAWMRSHAGIVIERYQMRLSSRRSLLSSLLALNPDTAPLSTDFDRHSDTQSEMQGQQGMDAPSQMGWLDPLLRDSPARKRWEEASRRALSETFNQFSVQEVASEGHEDRFWQSADLSWQTDYDGTAAKRLQRLSKEKGGSSLSKMLAATSKPDHWVPSVQEGLYVAARVQAEAERQVAEAQARGTHGW